MISNLGQDEFGRFRGGRAGDQTGKEWQIVRWYSYPWNMVIRYPDAKIRHWMGNQARAAANNNHIGYDQGQRQTFWTELTKVGYDASKVSTDCESDCSAGVLAIAKAAGFHFGVPELQQIDQTGYTGNMERILKNAGFQVLKASKYLDGDSYLDNGDILLNTVNHTAFNIDKGFLCDAKQEAPFAKTYVLPDVSEWQGDINWLTVKKNYDKVILRVHNGSRLDYKWERNVKACEELGIEYGVYIYGLAKNNSTLDKEAKAVLKALKGHKPVRVYYDIERQDMASYGATAVNRFCEKMEKNGYRAGFYTGASFYNSYLKGKVNYPAWIAAYGTNSGTPQNAYKPNVAMEGWQYTSVGRVEGISGNVDMNIFYKWGGETPIVPTKPTPNIYYAVKTKQATYADVKNGAVAGNGQQIVGIKIGVDIGSVRYRVHCGGRWLGIVDGNDWGDFTNGYAGDDRNYIDAIQIYYVSDREKTDIYEAVYQSCTAKGTWLGQIHDTNWENADGSNTSGIFRTPIGKIKISLEKVS